jgi:hypothetical protein
MYSILVGRPEGKRQRVRISETRYNIKMDLEEIWWEGVNWINLAQDMYHWQALVNTVMKL